MLETTKNQRDIVMIMINEAGGMLKEVALHTRCYPGIQLVRLEKTIKEDRMASYVGRI
jgi:hypothetical protein